MGCLLAQYCTGSLSFYPEVSVDIQQAGVPL